MRPTLHPRLVNGSGGDPVLYLEALHAPGAILIDCGDLAALAPRHLLRLEAVLVSHTHMDHWAGFDRLLRLLIGREKRLELVGPPGFARQLHHRLQSYTWNLVDRIPALLEFRVTEVVPGPAWPRHRLLLQSGFALEVLPPQPATAEGLALSLGPLRVRAALLDHGMPVLGFAVEEAAHLNVWRQRLQALGLPTGPWLARLKQAVLEDWPDETPIPVFARPGEADGAPSLPLARLRGVVERTPGQRLCWLTDLADTPGNRTTAIALARGADLLFIEAPFAAADAAHAAARQHLTTTAAGEIARAAGVRRVVPFHRSPRVALSEAEWLAEVAAAFGGPLGAAAAPAEDGAGPAVPHPAATDPA